MEAFRFGNQLLPDEYVLWHGQPDKEAFQRGEKRLVGLIVWFGLALSAAYGLLIIHLHGLVFIASHGSLPIFFLALALLVKVVFRFTGSSAGRYWYAVTDQRVFAEMPDEGSQTTIIVPLCDIKRLSLQQKSGVLGTIEITANAYRERKIYFQDIADAAEVCALLTDITTRPASA